MALLEECLNELMDYELYDEDESKLLYSKLVKIFPFAWWGKVDWIKMSNSFKVEDVADLLDLYKDQECYIFWDIDSLPAVKTSFHRVVECIEDVTIVGFYTWLVNSLFNCVVELLHDGEIMTGCNKIPDDV